MKLKSFIVREGQIIGIRLENYGKLYDTLISNFKDLKQLDVLNLDYLRGIYSYKDTFITSEELLNNTKIPQADFDVNTFVREFERPKTYVDVDLDFKRSVELDMLDWYYYWKDRVLYVEGARQTGKTYSIKKFIEKVWGSLNESDGVYCLNLSTNDFKIKWEKYLDYIKNTRYIKFRSSTLEGFLEYTYKDFSMDTAKVVYVDEIQDEDGIYNTIREFARECKCRLIVSGSYLNLVSQAKLGNNKFKPPAGGDYRIVMRSLSFTEFLQANGIINSQILFKSASEYTEEDNILFDKVQELYEVYLKLGGYPSVVKSYIQTGSIEIASEVLDDLVTTYFSESEPYLALCNPMAEFQTTFKSILEIMTNVNKRYKLKDITGEIKSYFKRNKKTIMENDICFTLNWLKSGGFIRPVIMYKDLQFRDYAYDQRYFFYDLGVVNYVARESALDNATINGYLAENFAFLQILDAFHKKEMGTLGYLDISKDKEIGNAELDFVFKDYKNKNGWVGIEVKFGNTKANSLNKLRDKNVFKSAVKTVKAKTNVSTGTIPIFCLKFYCMLDEF